MNQTAPILIWEDETPDTDHWWLSRARETGPAGRTDYFVAEDDVTNAIVAVALPPKARHYHIIAAIPIEDRDVTAAVIVAKSAVAQWCIAPRHTRGVWGWRFQRMTKIALRNLPIAIGGLIAGALLGMAVALFAISSGVVGWPMAVMGMLIGATAGPAIKLVVDRRHTTGAWARLGVVTAAAMVGAALSAGGLLTLFWS